MEGTDLEKIGRFTDPILELNEFVLVLRRLKKPSEGTTPRSFRELFDEGLKVATMTIQYG